MRWNEMQKTTKKRAQKDAFKQKREDEERMNLPVNKFLNAADENGMLTYSVAGKLRKYFMNNPDLALDASRMTNALLHELQWRKGNMIKYLSEHNRDSSQIEVKDNQGKVMSKDECYLAYISERVNVYAVLSKLRGHLVNKLLPLCDGVSLTFEQYNEHVELTEKKVKEIGYDLFPDNVDLVNPV